MQEFRIEGDVLRREARFRVLAWGTVLFLIAIAILLFVLHVSGNLPPNPNLLWLFVFTFNGAVIGACILAFREGLRRAERKMVFVLDESGLTRKRPGYAEIKIAFSEIKTLSEELGWLIVRSADSGKKIGIPKAVQGYEAVRAELAKHHSLSVSASFPWKRAVLPMISVLSWVAVLWFSDVRIVLFAGVVALITLAFASRRLWTLLHKGRTRLLFWACLGLAWLAAFLMIYLRVVQP
jgi:hypothetical protein